MYYPRFQSLEAEHELDINGDLNENMVLVWTDRSYINQRKWNNDILK